MKVAEKLQEPVTWRALFVALAAACVAFIAAELVFGNSIVSRAEAAAAAQVTPFSKQLEAVQADVREVRGDVKELLKRGAR